MNCSVLCVGNAIRALANYLMAETGLKDKRIRESIDKYSSFDAIKTTSSTEE
jgi:diaminopimelate epimerase